MNYKLKRSDKAMILRSGYLLNAGFLIPLTLTIAYALETPRITPWHMILFLLFASGATFREKWSFGEDKTTFKMGLFFIPMVNKSFPTSEICCITLKTFIRGEKISTQPGSDRKWFQTEQGVLKLQRNNEEQETLIMDTNKKNIQLQSMGEELAAYLEIPFKLNP